MKILLLQSSGRTGGNTARVLALTETALRADAERIGEPIEIETLHLARLDLRTCLGCRSCFNKGEETCPLKDDILTVKRKMIEADGLVLAGPVYVNDVNGIMKNWIDRLAHVCHRPAFAGKTAMLVATTGGTPAKHALRSMQVPLWTWGIASRPRRGSWRVQSPRQMSCIGATPPGSRPSRTPSSRMCD